MLRFHRIIKYFIPESAEIPENRITNNQKSIGESDSSKTTTEKPDAAAAAATAAATKQKAKKQKLKTEEKVDEAKFLDTQTFHSALESHPEVIEHWNQVKHSRF